jgi:hypothetical protein
VDDQCTFWRIKREQGRELFSTTSQREGKVDKEVSVGRYLARTTP